MKRFLLLLILTSIVYSGKPLYEYPTNAILLQLKTYMENTKLDDLKKLRLNEFFNDFFQNDNDCFQMIRDGYGHYSEFSKGLRGELSLLTVNENIFKFYQKIRIRKIKNSCWERFLNFDVSFIRAVFITVNGVENVLNDSGVLARLIRRMEDVEFLTIEKIFKFIFIEFESVMRKPTMNSNLNEFIKFLGVIFDKIHRIYDIVFGVEGNSGLVKINKELKKKNSKYYINYEL